MDATDRSGTVLSAELEINASFLPQFMVDRVASQALESTGLALKRHIMATMSLMLAPAGLPASNRKKRPKRILSVVSTPAGYRMQVFGKSFLVDDGNR